MATGTRKASNTRRSSGSGRQSGTGRGISSKQTPPAPNRTLLEKFISSPLMRRMSMPIIFIAAILLIVGIDLLFTWNDFSGFFKLLGIELLVAVVIWILKLIFTKSRTSDDGDSSVSEV